MNCFSLEQLVRMETNNFYRNWSWATKVPERLAVNVKFDIWNKIINRSRLKYESVWQTWGRFSISYSRWEPWFIIIKILNVFKLLTRKLSGICTYIKTAIQGVQGDYHQLNVAGRGDISIFPMPVSATLITPRSCSKIASTWNLELLKQFWPLGKDMDSDGCSIDWSERMFDNELSLFWGV